MTDTSIMNIAQRTALRVAKKGHPEAAAHILRDAVMTTQVELPEDFTPPNVDYTFTWTRRGNTVDDSVHLPHDAEWVTVWVQGDRLHIKHTFSEQDVIELEKMLVHEMNIDCKSIMVARLRQPAFSAKDFT